MFFLAIACFIAMAATAQQPQSKGQMNSQKLATTLYLIENFYVDTANIDKVTEDAIIAALKELDPHSAYISKKDVEKANEPLVGSFEGIGGGCDEEAVRVVKMMPKWIPAENDGEKVRVMFTLPINFRLFIEK